MKYLFSLAVLSLLVASSCNGSDEPKIKEVEVQFSIPNLSLVTAPLDNGRAEGSLPLDFVHPLGGTGILNLTNSNGDINIEVVIDGSKFLTTSFTLPIGTYNISYEVGTNMLSSTGTQLNCGISRTFPFTANASNVIIDENTSLIPLTGSTTFDLLLVRNQNLCIQFKSTAAIWDHEGNNSISENCDVGLSLNGNYYALYYNQASLVNNPELYVYYGAASPCTRIDISPTYTGAQAYIYSIDVSGSQALDIDLYSMFNADEIVIGVGNP